MPPVSAGLLLFRKRGGGIEVLLVHPGGPYWRHRDRGAWSIPKGEIAPDEDAADAAAREFAEELGTPAPSGTRIPLTPRRQPGGKLVCAWAVRADLDPSRITSNTVSIEWPPRSGHRHSFPEVDRAAWFPLATARDKIVKGQVGFLDDLVRALKASP
jgi:predicted NUDIX family NTP pyrophosphohydrolase